MSPNNRLLPAYPLLLNDPYFSIWANHDVLNESNTVFWTGKERKTFGVVSANGKNYSFLGNIEGLKKLVQTNIAVTAFRTAYQFACDDFLFEVAFFSPLPATDLQILSCPVCYIEYKIIPRTPLKNVSVSVSLHGEWCYNDMGNTEIRGDVFVYGEREIGYFGLNRQHVFNKTTDRYGADWGYYYIVGERCFVHNIGSFSDITAVEHIADGEKPVYLTAQNTYQAIDKAVDGKILVAFDDVVSIQYFGEMLRGYFFEGRKNIIDAIDFSLNEYSRICAVCAEIENELSAKSKKYGEKYELILNATYRQVIAGHKLVKDSRGRALLLSKECGSCGCTATVDVLYPAMPMLAYCNPKLLRAAMTPIFDFAVMPVWEYDFAPHDVGMYPFCNGQYYAIYDKKEGKYARCINFKHGNWAGKDVLPPYYLYPKGSNIYLYEKQMPVEESGNMLLAGALYLACGGDKEFISENLPLLNKWADYLVEKGLVPENQLCTDDFLQRMDKNINLAIKSVCGIAAFAQILDRLERDGSEYREIARSRAKEIESRFSDGHYPLSFDCGQDTFSMKYNLVPDKLLGLCLFSRERCEKEVDVCLENAYPFGIPLDNRSKMVKTDWNIWMAALTEDAHKRDAMIGFVYKVLTESPCRVPFSDWIVDAEQGTYREFINRTVQGSMFILLLQDMLLGE